MKLTIEQLRQSIRRVLLENIEHYEKVAKLLCTGTMESVKSALLLCETMGYVHDVKHDKRRSEFVGRKHPKYNDWTYEWEFSASQEFEDVLYEVIEKSHKVPGFAIFPRNGRVVINLRKHAPDERSETW